MNNKVYTVAIIGAGARGMEAYGRIMLAMPDKFKVEAVCDCNPIKLQRAKDLCALPDSGLFADEKEFFAVRRADVAVIATQDRDHVRMCLRALELGYDILLEKPISPQKEELAALLAAHKKYNRTITVCHVLRYAPAFLECKRLLDGGKIGRLVRIESIEQVAYWHQAHSFVRGNWRNEQETSAMIMQKCCHDFDLLQYYAGAKCKEVYSTGDLSYFNAANRPRGAADRCSDCKYIASCPYSAERPSFGWPYNVVDTENPNTEDGIRAAYASGDYGRCVFACDNNVVDNQSVSLTFENGVKATHTMTAFTEHCGRIMTFHGTLGELRLDEGRGVLEMCVFGEKATTTPLTDLVPEKDVLNHGGGDVHLVEEFYKVLSGDAPTETSLEESAESHWIALAAERSRKTDTVVRVHG